MNTKLKNRISNFFFALFLALVIFLSLGFGGWFRAQAESVLLQRGMDQFIFRGMDILGNRLERYGLKVEVSSPAVAALDDKDYDVLIGNSQGAIRSLFRKQKKKPKLVIAIDPILQWRKPPGVKTYVLYGLAGSPVKGAINIPTHETHLGMSFSEKTQNLVINILIENGIIRVW